MKLRKPGLLRHKGPRTVFDFRGRERLRPKQIFTRIIYIALGFASAIPICKFYYTYKSSLELYQRIDANLGDVATETANAYILRTEIRNRESYLHFYRFYPHYLAAMQFADLTDESILWARREHGPKSPNQGSTESKR